MPRGTPAKLLAASSADEVHLVFPEALYGELQSVLFPSDDDHPFAGKHERGAFCVLARSTGVRRVSYLVREVVHPTSPDDLAFGHGGSTGAEWFLEGGYNGEGTTGFRFSREYHGRAVRRAKELEGGLLRVHTHPSGVAPSSVDRRSARRVFVGDTDRLPLGAPLLAAITDGEGRWSARAYEFGNREKPQVTPISAIRIVGPRFEKRKTPASELGPAGAYGKVDTVSHESSVQLWGEHGQSILGGLRVGLVGCGGVGSLLASHLPRLGIGELVLVDFDRLQPGNANRADGATDLDIRQRRLKTRVAQREAHRAATTSRFDTRVIDGSVVEEDPEFAAVPALLDCDVIIAAVDAARPKKVLDHLATTHCLPILTGGSRLHVDDDGVLHHEAKIETSVTGPGFPCFRCQRIWRRRDVEEELEHPRFRGEQGYVQGGVDPEDTLRAPSVIGINSIVAGLIQHRLTALTLGITSRVVGTHRLRPSNLSAKWTSTGGSCGEGCERPLVAAGDQYPLPLGTDLTMRFEREDIPMPETDTIGGEKAEEILGLPGS